MMKFNSLLSQSDYWPRVFKLQQNNEIYLSTLVRINRNKLWHVVHCVECAQLTNRVDEDIHWLWERLAMNVSCCQEAYKINSEVKFNPIDPLQVSEKIRLIRIRNFPFNDVPVKYLRPNLKELR